MRKAKRPVPKLTADNKIAVDFTTLREPLRAGMDRWIQHGIQPGGFLSAVIANNLREAFVKADDENIRAMASIVNWFYNEMPAPAWGWPEKAKAWAKRFGRDFDWAAQ